MDTRNICAQWERLRRLPGGAKLFSRFIGWTAPYTGSIGAEVLELRPGLARVRIQDRRRVRNHLKSIHAMALSNLAELAGSLSLMASLPDYGNMIPIGISIEWVKKARGTITAEGTVTPPADGFAGEIEPAITLRDADGDEVARARLRVRVRAAATKT